MNQIGWCDTTWNPIRGCSRVSAGCQNCYAERQAVRMSRPPRDVDGVRVRDPHTLYNGIVRSTPDGPRWTGEVEFDEEKLADPLRWRKPRRIFVNSMSDLFHEKLTDEQIAEVFGVMAVAGARQPDGSLDGVFSRTWDSKMGVFVPLSGRGPHTFLVLTKRSSRMRSLLTSPEFRAKVARAAFRWACDRTDAGYLKHQIDLRIEESRCYPPGRMWPLSNVHLGVSVEDQKTADERIPDLLATPSAVRWVSYEPALGPIRLEMSIDWVVVGGESGPSARPCEVAWIRSAVRQCRRWGIPCYVKQLGAHVIDRNDAGFDGNPGEWPEDTQTNVSESWQGAPTRIFLHNPKGADPSEWPEDLRVREFPH